MGNYGLYIFCLGGLFIAFPCKFIDIRWCFVPPAKEVKTDGWQAARSFWTPRIAAHSNSTHFRDALILLVSGHLHKRKKKRKKGKYWKKKSLRVANHWTATPTDEGVTLLYLLLITLGTNRHKRLKEHSRSCRGKYIVHCTHRSENFTFTPQHFLSIILWLNFNILICFPAAVRGFRVFSAFSAQLLPLCI